MAKSGSRVLVAVEAVVLATALTFLIILLVRPSFLSAMRTVVFGPGIVPAAQAGGTTAAGGMVATNPPGIMTVPPRDMYAVFLDQYRMRPDRRAVMAFDTLALRWGQWRGETTTARFRAGAAVAQGERIVVPLLRDGVAVRQAALPVPASFAQVQASLDEWVAAMDGDGGAALPPPGPAATSSREFEEADRLIDTVDPRHVLAGLAELERLWRRGTRDARILRTAARAYATLLMVLEPDEMGLADPLAAEALALLALCRRADPSLSVAREEALVAMTMGYRAHAAGVLERMPRDTRSVREAVLDAYLRDDALLLRRAQENDPGVLGPYLLARHYREVGLRSEAAAASRSLLARWPTLYPSAVEAIRSGNLDDAKALTILYPHQITEQVRALVDPAALKGFPAWVALLPKITAGTVMPFAEFQGLLDAWAPFGSDAPARFLVDANRVKAVFGSLYADAVHFRFTLLFDRWAVRDMAGTYAETLAATDNTHPLVALMRAEIAADRGNRAAADRLYRKVIASGGVGGHQLYEAYRGLSDELTRIQLLPETVGRLDGRPRNLLLAGWLLADAYNQDLAVRYYDAGLAQDPYAWWAHAALAQARGTDAPLYEALKAHPGSFGLLRAAGEYFAGKKDAASLDVAERALAAAQAVAPSVGSLARQRARVLGSLGRHAEAIVVLDAWLRKHKDDGLESVIVNARRAQAYVKMGRPRDALRVLGRDAESMQGTALAAAAEAHEASGNLAAAWDYHRRGVERYPTNGPTLAGAAAFLWRQGRYDEAAELIAAGRPSRKRFDRWYWELFLSAFRDAPDEDVARAVAALKSRGATSDEIEFLAFRLHDAGRSAAAFGVASALRDPTMMWDIERAVGAYRILRQWKGRETASGYLRKRIPAGQRGPLLIVLYKTGQYEAILEEAGDPSSYGPMYEEFVWLQKLLAWLALERRPAELAAAFDSHYRGATSDKYHAIGRYMLGTIPRDALLDTARAAKDRCEFAYYVGFSERLKGNFAEAAQWYHLCKETLLQNNGELHWAGDELFWWAHMGIANRHRLMRDDVAAREKDRRQDASDLALI